jgi:hypothetical protein
MKRKALGLLLLAAFSTAAVSSCGKETEKTPSKEQTGKAESENLKPEPLSKFAGNEKLPPGHPPINNEQLPPGHPPIGEESKNNLPQGHPPINGGAGKDLMAMHSGKNMTKFDRPIRIPEEVQKTWKSAQIEIVDKTTGKAVKEFKVHNGETVKYGGLEIKVLYIVPHLVLDNGYTSASNEPQNPAILVVVKENGKTIYAGPIYQKFPTMYNINHPRYEIILKGISKSS